MKLHEAHNKKKKEKKLRKSVGRLSDDGRHFGEIIMVLIDIINLDGSKLKRLFN